MLVIIYDNILDIQYGGFLWFLLITVIIDWLGPPFWVNSILWSSLKCIITVIIIIIIIIIIVIIVIIIYCCYYY